MSLNPCFQKSIFVKVIIVTLFILSLLQTTKVFGLVWDRTLLPVSDFDVYYQAMKKIRSGENPYDDLGLGQGMTFLYPTASGVIFYPLTFFSPSIANMIFHVFNYLCFGGIIFLIFLFHNGSIKNWSKVFLISAFAMQTFTFKFNLTMNQANIPMLFFICLSLLLEKKNKVALAALAMAVATSIKLVPIFLLPYWIVKKKWSFVSYWLSFFVLLHLPFGNYGFDYYFNIIPNLQSWGADIVNVYNQSLNVMLARIWGDLPVNTILVIVLSLLLYGWFLFSEKGKQSFLTPFCLLAVVIFARSPVWLHYLVYLLPIIILSRGHNLWSLFLLWLPLQIHTNQSMLWLQQYPYLMSYGAYYYLLIMFLVMRKTIRNNLV